MRLERTDLLSESKLSDSTNLAPRGSDNRTKCVCCLHVVILLVNFVQP